MAELYIVQLTAVTLVRCRWIYVQLHDGLLLKIIIRLRSTVSVDLDPEPTEWPQFPLTLFWSVETEIELCLSLNCPRQNSIFFHLLSFRAFGLFKKYWKEIDDSSSDLYFCPQKPHLVEIISGIKDYENLHEKTMQRLKFYKLTAMSHQLTRLLAIQIGTCLKSILKLLLIGFCPIA